MKIRAFNLGFLLATLTIPVFATQTVVGKISFAKGSNAAQQPNAAPRLLGKDAEVYQGDNIQTTDASFVIVEFNDGSKVTIRPNSNFKIEQFDSANKNAKLTVYEGAVRATTGEFAKQGGDNFQIKTPTATLKGAKDSDYSVSVCKENCDKDKKTDVAKDVSIAKVVDIKGDVYAQNRVDKNANERKLTMGAGLNPQDFLTSQANSYVVMVFRDNQKVTLQPNSEFDIVKYDYQQPGKKDQILFKLATGGLRSLTGSIGKKDHSAYALDTPVATIGIRGTEIDTLLTTDAANSDAQPGCYNTVTEGSGSVTNASGTLNLETNQNSFTADANTPSTQIPTLPTTVSNQNNSVPNPTKAPDSTQTFTSTTPSPTSGASSAIKVNSGTGTVAQKSDDKSDEKGGKSDKSEEKTESKTDNKTENKTESKSSTTTNTASSNQSSGGTVLAAGDSLTSSESGQSSSGVSETVAQEFENTPAPNDNSGVSIMASPLNDTGSKNGENGCAI